MGNLKYYSKNYFDVYEEHQTLIKAQEATKVWCNYQSDEWPDHNGHRISYGILIEVGGNTEGNNQVQNIEYKEDPCVQELVDREAGRTSKKSDHDIIVDWVRNNSDVNKRRSYTFSIKDGYFSITLKSTDRYTDSEDSSTHFNAVNIEEVFLKAAAWIRLT